MRRLARAGVLSSLLGGVSAGTPAKAAVKERAADTIVEAVFASLLREAAPSPAETTCLAVRWTVEGKERVGDPGEALLARLQKRYPRVRKATECRRALGQRTTDAATMARKGASWVVRRSVLKRVT